ncbi:MAG: TIR domain-containing protein [Clostridiales bacterium]|nr:TIR domain-containing protein [Clostridiales bacterium]
MSVLKCKMCGGDLEVIQGMSVCECMYCGSRQTLPKMGSEKKNNLYDRASHFRRNNEYDKAMSIYEQILNEEVDDAETYWSILLCRYGIEYVEDPATHKRIPTVNRAQMTSVFLDEDYKAAIKYADEEQRKIYEAEAKEIDRIQKEILAISSKEEPFDVFICYKESDANGRRTEDSVLANDLYHQLTQEGFRVFFARITLEDKLGSAYEPYIFAALNSAKVMVVLGTKPEYFNAVWVKNEWSRYLLMIKGGAKKILIPAYKNMDPYDLPEEFSHLQAQDMSKLGFMQDLIRGIKKMTGTAEINNYRGQQSSSQASPGSSTEAFLKRGFMALEDNDFTHADGFFEQVLNLEPENAMAYVGKLMADRQVQHKEELSNGTEELTDNNYFQRSLQFAEDGLKKELEKYNSTIINRNETNRKNAIYDKVVHKMEQSEQQKNPVETVERLTEALKNVQEIAGWKDADEKKLEIQEKLKKAQKSVDDWKKEREQRIRKIRLAAVAAAVVVLIISSICVVNAKIKVNRYETAVAYMNEGEYENAIKLFKKTKGYKDSKALLAEVSYRQAVVYMEAEEYEKAIKIFTGLKVHDSEELLIYCQNEASYKQAVAYMEAEEYEKAAELFTELKNYEDSEERLKSCQNEPIYRQAVVLMEKEEYVEAIELFTELIGIRDYKDSRVLMKNCQNELEYQQAIVYLDEGQYSAALDILYRIKSYKDSEEQIMAIKSEILKNAQVGDIVYYGHDSLDVYEKLQWKVLDKCDNKILLFAQFKIYNDFDDFKVYDDFVILDCAVWENSEQRAYLNKYFYEYYFFEEEKNRILITNLDNSGSLEFGGDSGNNTQDKVFALSYQEAVRYAVIDDSDEVNWWSTRTNTEDDKMVYIYCGKIKIDDVVSYGGGRYRPAMWVSLE